MLDRVRKASEKWRYALEPTFIIQPYERSVVGSNLGPYSVVGYSV